MLRTAWPGEGWQVLRAFARPLASHPYCQPPSCTAGLRPALYMMPATFGWPSQPVLYHRPPAGPQEHNMAEKEFYYRRLPHWHPADATFFVTFRLEGSLPAKVAAELKGALEDKLVSAHKRWVALLSQ